MQKVLIINNIDIKSTFITSLYTLDNVGPFVLSVYTSYGGGIEKTNIWWGSYHSFDESNPMLHELLEFPV